MALEKKRREIAYQEEMCSNFLEHAFLPSRSNNFTKKKKSFLKKSNEEYNTEEKRNI